ncbi:MAG: hypothetical protein U0903_04835 [Planctomycetales bacterium]
MAQTATKIVTMTIVRRRHVAREAMMTTTGKNVARAVPVDTVLHLPRTNVTKMMTAPVTMVRAAIARRHPRMNGMTMTAPATWEVRWVAG